MENITIDIGTNTRIVKIRNKRGRIMFLVEFLVKPVEFVVKVREITDLDIPFDVVRTVYPPSQVEQARKNFRKLVEDYQNLVNSIDREDVEPRQVFDEAVNYHKIDPDCCFTCEFSKYEHTHGFDAEDHHKKCLMCFQKKNIRQHGHICREFCKNGSFEQIKPVKVHEGCLCNNFKREKREFIMDKKAGNRRFELKYLYHDHDLVDLIRVMQENRLVEFEDEIYIKNGEINPKFESNVLSVVSNEISASPQISSAVENIVVNTINKIDITEIRGGDDKPKHENIEQTEENTYTMDMVFGCFEDI